MVAYTFVRRSMMSISFAGDGQRAVDNAQSAIDLAGTTPRVRGLAKVQQAMGYALEGASDDSSRALDEAMRLPAKPVREEEALLGQRSVVGDDLHAVYRTTCDIYLGRGDSVIPVLEPRLAALSQASVRTATITGAKLARAYANAGQPLEACRLACQTLAGIDSVGSLYALSELRRTLPVLNYWPNREDVRDLSRRIRETRPLWAV